MEKLTVEEAIIVRTFLDTTTDNHADCGEVYSAFMDVCPHPSYSYGGSMGNVCDVCGAMQEGPTWSLDRIAALLVAKGCTGAYVEQTGGGCATLYVGTGPVRPSDVRDGRNVWGARYALAAGPGWFEGPGFTDAHVGSDFCYGPDDDGDTPPVFVTEGTEEEIADTMFAFVSARTDCALELATGCGHCSQPLSKNEKGDWVCTESGCYFFNTGAA